jgi:D-tagatose-1,6-bisphosphate aldolase subunit GatZ/KbaZ
MSLEKILANKALPSFCTSNFLVVERLLIFCKKNKLPALIETTSNQVNQDGGYSKNQPKDFVKKINKLAKRLNVSKKYIYYGADHLGPLPWKKNNHKLALKKSIRLLHLCLKAKYNKIHIDASIRCNDDKLLTNKDIFIRTQYILKNLQNKKNLKEIFFVFGTEVPLAGGNDKNKIKTTEIDKITQDYDNFSKLHKSTKMKIKNFALVIEPGMNFKHKSVVKPNLQNFHIKKKFSKKNNFCFEAHSTDYQKFKTLKNLVKNNFKILKVGPELTYNLIKSLLFMEDIEKKSLGKNSDFKNTVLKKMFANNIYFKDYFKIIEKKKLKKNIFNSYYDRARYYLYSNDVKNSVKTLKININKFNRQDIIESLLKKKIMKKDNNFNSHYSENFNFITSCFLDIIFLKYYKACGFKNLI